MKNDRFVMVRPSKSVKRHGTSACGDNAMTASQYYLRHNNRELAKPLDHTMSRQNANNKLSIVTTDILSRRTCKYCVHFLVALFTILLCIVCIGMLFPYPSHASCIVKWRFGEPCKYVMQKFRCQIMNWSSWNVCRQHSDNCIYTLQVPAEDNVIRAMHVTSNLKFENIKIIFKEVNNTCLATASSTSNEWFSIFDYGENYCNLHKLVVGADLDRHTEFLELTSDDVCTQFNMAACE